MSQIKYRESDSGFSVTIPKPSLHYLDQFIKLKCASDLLKLGIFPNAKEISESIAALTAVRKALGAPRFGDDKVLLLDVGSGVTGRTGVLFAHLTRRTCLSIDPRLRKDSLAGVTRWQGIKSMIEEFIAPPEWPLVIAVCVHSHAPLQAVWEAIKGPREKVVVSIPCCVPQSIQGLEPTTSRNDWGIWSEKREVRVWHESYPKETG